MELSKTHHRILDFALILVALCPFATTLRAADPPWSRPWKIYVITHTHADIGYTDLIPEVKRVWCQGMDQAIAAAGKGLKWTLEGSLLFDTYRQHRSPEKVAELVRLVKEGKIEIASLYTNIEQENAAPEELVRSTFYSNDRMRREFGIESKTAILDDITGITWGLPRALAGSGTRYLAFGPGRYKEMLDESTLPQLFYYKSQDGSRVLMLMRVGKYQSYGSARSFLEMASMEKAVPELLQYYEGLGEKYPYDAIMVQLGSDNVNPHLNLVDNIQAWNSQHANPHVIMATPSEFFGYIEEKYGSKIPEFSGDITSAWTDDPGIYPLATGMKRQAANDVLSAEKFATIGEMVGSDRPYPQDTIERTYKDLLIYTDHTYGLATWGWEYGPLLQSAGQLWAPTWDTYKESWEEKKEFAYEAGRLSGELLGDSVEALAAEIPTEGRSIVVFNPLSWPRTDVVQILHRALKTELTSLAFPGAQPPRSGAGRVSVLARTPYEIIDASTGEKVPYQPLTGDRGGDVRYDTIVFIAKDVPALGYKTYRVVPADAAPQFPEGSVKLRGNVIENEFYRVEVDANTGGVSSILDKQLGRELVDRNGTERVNQYLYYSLTGDHEAIYQDNQTTVHLGRIWTKQYNTAIYSPLAAHIEPGQDGPAMKSLRAEIHMNNAPAPTDLTQEVVLYPGIKRIDFVNRLHKAPTLTKEEVYYAFPFDVKDFEIHCELPGAVFRPYTDQLSGSFTGFSGIQYWADASNADYGVAVATREVPAIEFAEIRTNEWTTEYKPTRSAFYFYVMNNKENTNGAQWQGSEWWRMGFLDLHFAVTSHAKDWKQGNVTEFGWEHNTPLVARYIANPQSGKLPAKQASFCGGLPKNVILQSLKKAEDGQGYVARFYETEGQAAEVTWSGLPLKVRQAQKTDLVERPAGQVKIEGDKISFAIGPWQLVTIRLLP